MIIRQKQKIDLISILKEYNSNIKYIKCGGESKIMQEREQWTDGANSFALSPGKIIGYDCNPYTLNELKKMDTILLQPINIKMIIKNSMKQKKNQ